MMGQIKCDCKDCLDTFYANGDHHYTEDHCLYHHPECNHITQKVFDKIEFEDEVWVDDIGIYVKKMVVQWSGYRCTCKQEYEKEE